MSCDYEIRCKTCSSIHSFNDANHQDDLMRSLVNHAPLIAAIAPLFLDTGYRVELRTSYGCVDPSWFAQHLGHELAVFDEYGREDGTCMAHYRCGLCEASHSCNLAKGHAGEHGRNK